MTVLVEASLSGGIVSEEIVTETVTRALAVAWMRGYDRARHVSEDGRVSVYRLAYATDSGPGGWTCETVQP